MLRKTALNTIVAGAALCLAAASGSAETIRVSVGVPATHPAWVGFDAFIKEVEAKPDVDLKFDSYVGGSLLSLKATLTGIRDGIADAGMYTLAYWPAEFPHGKMVADLALLGNSATAMAGAVAEFNLLQCPDCQREFKQQKMVYVAPYSTPPYYLISDGKITTVDDLKNKKIRVGGSVWARWAQAFGATPVSLPGVESYEAMSQGQIDATIASAAYLKSISMWEVADNITLINLGTFHSVAVVGFGADIWRDLSNEQRAALLDSAATAMTVATLKYIEDDEVALREAGDHGVSVNEPSEDLASASRAFVEKDLELIITEAEKQFRISNAREKVDTFISLLEKWDDLTSPLKNDREKLVSLYKEQIFDKLDPESYGL